MPFLDTLRLSKKEYFCTQKKAECRLFASYNLLPLFPSARILSKTTQSSYKPNNNH